MESIPKQHLAWFEAKRTEKRSWQKASAPFVVSGYSRNLIKGMVLIGSSFLLFGVSFSPAWGNPDVDHVSNQVLIPIDKLMNGEEEEEPPSSDVSNREAPVESTQSEDQAAVKQQENQLQPSKPENKHNESVVGEKKDESPHPHPQTKKADDARQKQESITDDGKKNSPARNNDRSDVQTENGGTLPDTATPFGTLLVRGMALVLLGFGLRSIAKKSER